MNNASKTVAAVAAAAVLGGGVVAINEYLSEPEKTDVKTEAVVDDVRPVTVEVPRVAIPRVEIPRVAVPGVVTVRILTLSAIEYNAADLMKNVSTPLFQNRSAMNQDVVKTAGLLRMIRRPARIGRSPDSKNTLTP